LFEEKEYLLTDKLVEQERKSSITENALLDDYNCKLEDLKLVSFITENVEVKIKIGDIIYIRGKDIIIVNPFEDKAKKIATLQKNLGGMFIVNNPIVINKNTLFTKSIVFNISTKEYINMILKNVKLKVVL
jgi:hypothetical protein